MSSDKVDTGRRRFLTASTAVVGGAGVAAAAVPFLRAFKPSARAEAAGAPVDVDISKLKPGQKLEAAWRGKPVFVIRRTEQALEVLDNHTDRLRDPDSTESDQPEYATNPHRSIKPEYLVLVAICTHLGCVPLFVPELEPQPYDQDWPGGFFCPCHQSRFDMAGRVFQGVPAPTNLSIPPYTFSEDGSAITVGVNPEEGAAA